jgi:hypothetical protein
MVNESEEQKAGRLMGKKRRVLFRKIKGSHNNLKPEVRSRSIYS